MAFPSNIHPADELFALRAQIKTMQERESALRDMLIAANDAGREGADYRAFVIPSKRETLDRKAAEAALGREVLEPFLKTAEIKTVKLAKREVAAEA